MQRNLFIISLLFVSSTLLAQVSETSIGDLPDTVDSTAVTLPSIVDRINTIEPGKGRVRVIQDKLVDDRIGRPKKKTTTLRDEYIEMSGWRVQVFAGNNQRNSKEEAFQKETEIKLSFPELPTYVQYTAPFWRLRVGDFRTYKDASDVLATLKRSFPSFGREMSIIKETILVKK
jgi:hypothetical protein